MPELETPEPKTGALICWPVLWDEPNEGRAPLTSDGRLHVTAFYWREDPPLKKYMLDAFSDSYIYRGYTVAKVKGPEAFGQLNDYPVLTVNSGYHWYGINKEYTTMRNILTKAGIDNYDQRFEYNAHCSVDLKTVLNPPKRLIIGPPELWYKDDEAVAL